VTRTSANMTDSEILISAHEMQTSCIVSRTVENSGNSRLLFCIVTEIRQTVTRTACQFLQPPRTTILKLADFGRVVAKYDTIRDAILTCARKPTRVKLNLPHGNDN